MILFPTIELQNGKCVSLHRGKLDEPHIWHVDPVARAVEYANAGAEWLHLTDFDAIEGRDDSEEIVAEILRKVAIPVQLAGGFRSRERVEAWIDRGVGRVVIGTLAVQAPQEIKAMAKLYPDQVVLAIDVWRGQVMIDGWRTSTAFTPEGFLEAYSEVPLAGVVVTDIDSDVDGSDGTLALITKLAGLSRWPVIASGLVRELDDISRLTLVRNVSGAIVGRALMQRDFTIEEALAVAVPASEPTAEFM